MAPLRSPRCSARRMADEVVVELGREADEARRVDVAVEQRDRLAGCAAAVVEVGVDGPLVLVGLVEPCGGELADGLGQAIAHVSPDALRGEQRLVDERLEHVDHVGRVRPRRPTTRRPAARNRRRTPSTTAAVGVRRRPSSSYDQAMAASSERCRSGAALCRWRRSCRLSPRRSAIWRGVSVRTRAAASSMPSGDPSTVAQMVSTDCSVAASRSSAWPAARARSTNSSRGVGHASDVVGGGQWLHGHDVLAGDAQAFAAGGQHARRRGTRDGWPRPRVAAIASTCSQLSSTMSVCWVARRRATAASRSSPPSVRAAASLPNACSARRSSTSASPPSASSTAMAPCEKRWPTVAATSSARRVLPTPPEPTSVTSGSVATSAAHLGQLVVAADERRVRALDAGRLGVRAQRRELEAEVGDDQLVDGHRLGQVAQLETAEQFDHVAFARREGHSGLVGEQDLPAVCGRHDARGPVRCGAEVVAVAFVGSAGVHAHAHLRGEAAGPLLGARAPVARPPRTPPRRRRCGSWRRTRRPPPRTPHRDVRRWPAAATRRVGRARRSSPRARVPMPRCCPAGR